MGKFAYTLHNTVGHPVMELLWLLGFKRLADRVHSATLPKERDHA